VDTRIIAATNRDLQKEVEAGRFREDLFYRLNVFPLSVPPLRARKEDIIPLAEHFLKRFLTDMNRPVRGFTPSQIRQLESYDWPGNVRELQNIVERFAISSLAGTAHSDLFGICAAEPGAALKALQVDGGEELLTEKDMIQLQIRNIKKALSLCKGRIYGADGAAALLGLKPTTLATRMKKLNISRQST
jgi:transcriptional regulator with GAF, ATPase, and Fis domain